MNIHLGRIEKRKALAHLLVDSAKVNICVVTETRFLPNRGDELMKEIFEKEYEWYGRERKDQKARGGEGGVGILVRKGLGRTKVVKVSERYDLIWLEVEMSEATLVIAGVYLSPEFSQKEGSLEELLGGRYGKV
jgi:hypothetical protein